MIKSLSKYFSWIAIATFCMALPAYSQEETIQIKKPGVITDFTPPTPIVVKGYSGEVAKVLNFDLTVMGFKEVEEGGAQYTLSGSNNGSVQGQLSFGKTVIFSKVYTGSSLRSQAHRLADEVVFKLTGVQGIAESRIAFCGYNILGGGQGKKGEIYVSDFDGYNAKSVTSDDVDVCDPCWVPGRLAMFYTSYKSVYPRIFYQNLTSGERRVFSSYPGMNAGSAVSPDGTKVAMVLSRTGSSEIWVKDLSGGEARQLTTSAHQASGPCWSPDSSTICFSAVVGGRTSLYKVSASGGGMERVRTDGVGRPTEPDWSPDGKWIAFTSQASDFSICVIPASGGSATPIVTGQDPSWAPNSRTLVYVKRSGTEHLVLSVLDVPTKQYKDAYRVTGNHSNNSQPSWAR